MDDEKNKAVSGNKSIEHTFYFIGDGGNSPIGTKTEAIKDFENEVSKSFRE